MDLLGISKTTFKTLICLRPYPDEKRINIPGFTGFSDPAIGLAMRTDHANHGSVPMKRGVVGLSKEIERTMGEIIKMRPIVNQVQALDARAWAAYSTNSLFQGEK